MCHQPRALKRFLSCDNGVFQAHFERCTLPISDYVTDTRSVLDQAVRVINAMLDIAAGFGLLETTLGLLRLHQMLVQVSAVASKKSKLRK